MQTVKFVTVEKDKVMVWCETNSIIIFRDFMQYVLDDMNHPEDFMIIDTRNDLVYGMYCIATKQYKMRKRTFEERMNDVQTGILDIIHCSFLHVAGRIRNRIYNNLNNPIFPTPYKRDCNDTLIFLPVRRMLCYVHPNWDISSALSILRSVLRRICRQSRFSGILFVCQFRFRCRFDIWSRMKHRI